MQRFLISKRSSIEGLFVQRNESELGVTDGKERREGEEMEGRTVKSEGQQKLKGLVAATGSQSFEITKGLLKSAVNEKRTPQCQKKEAKLKKGSNSSCLATEREADV